jgi:superfamily I DNA/RNA helicase
MLRHAHPEDFPKREKDLEHFVTIATRYRSLASLLTDMALEPPTDSVGDVLAADVDEGLLTLSTIHSAKGLEWSAVFVIWLVDGRFPSYHNLHDTRRWRRSAAPLRVGDACEAAPPPELPDRRVRPHHRHGAREAVALPEGSQDTS